MRCTVVTAVATVWPPRPRPARPPAPPPGAVCPDVAFSQPIAITESTRIITSCIFTAFDFLIRQAHEHQRIGNDIRVGAAFQAAHESTLKGWTHVDREPFSTPPDPSTRLPPAPRAHHAGCPPVHAAAGPPATAARSRCRRSRPA